MECREVNIGIYISRSLSNVASIQAFSDTNEVIFIGSSDDIDESVFSKFDYTLLILSKQSEPLKNTKAFRSQSKFDAIGYFSSIFNNVTDIDNCICTLRDLLINPGILSNEQINNLIRLNILIYSDNEVAIESASCDLTVDAVHLVSGAEIRNQLPVVINPLDYVVVGAAERANMPSNICAHFGLLVSMFCRGLILSNGPQVDPGFRGRLFSLLFNASNQKYEIDTNCKIFTIVFTALPKKSSKPYDGKFQYKDDLNDYINIYVDKTLNISYYHEKIKSIATDVEKSQKLINKHGGIISKAVKDIEKHEDFLSSSGIARLIAYSTAVLSIIVTLITSYDYFGLHQSIGALEQKYSCMNREINHIGEVKSYFDLVNKTIEVANSTSNTEFLVIDNELNNN